MRIHTLKTWPEYFEAIKKGDKTFEIRKHDRDFQIGDIISLLEYNPETEQFTGEAIPFFITYILNKQPFIPEGYVCMGIKPMPKMEEDNSELTERMTCPECNSVEIAELPMEYDYQCATCFHKFDEDEAVYRKILIK